MLGQSNQLFPIEEILSVTLPMPMYNFHVEELENYCVGSFGFLVHNTNEPTDGTPPGAPGDPPKKPHGNTTGDQDATLYKKYDKDGNFEKHGVTQDPKKRYTAAELDGGRLEEIETGPRKGMLKKERDLVERDPGPKNKELWAGKRRGEN